MVSSGSGGDAEAKAATGMVLPFDPLALSFHDLCYYVPIPSVRSNEHVKIASSSDSTRYNDATRDSW